MDSDAVGRVGPIETVAMARSRPPDASRINVLGVGISALNLPEALQNLEAWRAEGRHSYVCCVCVHGIVTAQRDPVIREALNGAGMATKDGMPLAWWTRLSGVRESRRLSGSDLFDAVCADGLTKGYRHYFYGSTPQVLERLVGRMTARHPGLIVAGYHSPPFRPMSAAERDDDIAMINNARPDFVWVGLGMPKQERWMAAHVGRIDATALVGVGAAFDFHAGTKQRAPAWMRRSGLEWLFRLLTEPRRLARRYLIDNTVFVALTARRLASFRSIVDGA